MSNDTTENFENGDAFETQPNGELRRVKRAKISVQHVVATSPNSEQIVINEIATDNEDFHSQESGNEIQSIMFIDRSAP